MSPLPYHTDTTTEKIAFTTSSKMDASSTPVPNMWKKMGVAVLVGTAFVAGKSFDSSSKKLNIASGDLLGAAMTVPLLINCDNVPTGGKVQCQCTNDNCAEEYNDFVNNANFGECFVRCGFTDRSKDCINTCLEESQSNKLRKCVVDNNCWVPF